MLTTIAAGRVFNYSHCIGMFGMGGQGFWNPVDFAFGPGGIVYAVNRGGDFVGGQWVTKLTVDHEFISQFGTPGSGDGQFTWPVSIVVDRDGNVYVSDEQLQRISIFDKDGKFLEKWGQPGVGDGQLNGPSGMTFDHEDNLYIVDSLNSRVQKFTKDGKFLAKWGRPGSGDGEFDMPWGICVDKGGDVYVADWKNSRVQKFSPDGRFLATYGSAEQGVGESGRPSDVAVDSDGDVYVTDWSNDRLQIYNQDGAFIASLIGDSQQLSPWAQTFVEANPDVMKARRRAHLEQEWRFRRPVAVHVDSDNSIYVLETARHRIQVYEKERDYEEAALNL